MEALNEEERALAEANVGLIDRFLRLKRLDPEEWYDVAVFGYLAGIQYICRNLTPEGVDSITPLLFNSMKMYVMKEMRDQRAQKRGGGVAPMSLDAPVPGAEDDGDGSPLYELIPGRDDVEQAVVDRDLAERIFAKASPGERKAARYFFAGYSQEEAAKLCGSTERSVSAQICYLRKKAAAVRDERPYERISHGSDESHREYQRRYREAHREEINAYYRQWASENREAVRAAQKKYREKKRKEAAG